MRKKALIEEERLMMAHLWLRDEGTWHKVQAQQDPADPATEVAFQ